MIESEPIQGVDWAVGEDGTVIMTYDPFYQQILDVQNVVRHDSKFRGELGRMFNVTFKD